MSQDESGGGLNLGAAVGGLAVIVVIVVAVVGVISWDVGASRRLDARANLERAEAAAFEQRQQARTEAAEVRAQIRASEREASHQRTLEMLPYVALVVGAVVVVALAVVLVWWSVHRRQADAAMLLYLERLRLEQQVQNGELWAAIAQVDRRALGSGDKSVVIYTDKRQT